MDQFRGQTAFVTGGASGIGLALCRAFGQRGMNVAVADIETTACAEAVERLRGEGIRAIGAACDVSDRDSLAQAAYLPSRASRFGQTEPIWTPP